MINDLSGWIFSNQNLTGANFFDSPLTNANFTDAIVTGVDFGADRGVYGNVGALTASQLYSTASYKHGDLTGIKFKDNFLNSWNFVNQNLTGVVFNRANLANADFTGAIIKEADFSSPTFPPPFYVYAPLTAHQLYSTASYASHDLSGVRLGGVAIDLTGGDFTSQNLTNADLSGAILTNATFAGAMIKGASFSSTTSHGFTAAQLYSTASYANSDLTGILLANDDLTGWSFAKQNISNAWFYAAILNNTNFAGAIIKGAYFDSPIANALTFAQFSSSASYASGELSGIRLSNNDLTGWDFSNLNLSNAAFYSSKLTNTSFSRADLRGAIYWAADSTMITHNTIRPDGSIQGLALLAGEKLVIRNNPLAVTVKASAAFDSTSTLQFVLDQNWTLPVGFASGLTPSLSGALDLEFANGVDPSALVGDTFKLFNWNGPLPAGDQFSSIASAPGLSWDLRNLYTTGTVTLTGVPEPSAALLAAIGIGIAARFAR